MSEEKAPLNEDKTRVDALIEDAAQHGSDGSDSSESSKGAKAKVEDKAKIKSKSFLEKLDFWSKKINAQMGSTFLAYLQVGKALRMASAAFIAEGKTMKDFDLWVTESCDFNPTTASNYRRMSEFFHVTHPKILEVVDHSYLRKLEFTIVHDLFAACEAKENGKPKYKLVVTWDAHGIYASIGEEGVPVDLKKFTTRALKEKLRQSGKSNPKVPEASNTAGTNVPQEPVAPNEPSGEYETPGPKKHLVDDGDRIKKLKSRYVSTVTKLNKERKELRQKLKAAKQRADELEAELQELRMHVSVGKVAV